MDPITYQSLIRHLSNDMVEFFGGPDPHNRRASTIFATIYGYLQTGFSKLIFRNNSGTKAVYIRSLVEAYNTSYIDRTFNTSGVLENFYYPLNEDLQPCENIFCENFSVEVYSL